MIVILCIVPICVFAYFEIIGKTHFLTYSSNKIILLMLYLINIAITFSCIKFYDKLDKWFTYVILLIYLIIINFIPCYHKCKTYALTGSKNYLMGPVVERDSKDIFGISLKCLGIKNNCKKQLTL